MRFTALFALLLLACVRALPPAPEAEVPPEVELPREVRPLAYDLELTVSPEREKFEGAVDIELELERPLSAFWLNLRELSVEEVYVESEGIQVKATLQQGREGVARVRIAHELPAGRATLHLDFAGALNSEPHGLFRVFADGEAYVYTQAQPIDARRIFPCFDDPYFRAPFDLTLTVPAGDTAVSNAPVVAEEETEGGMKRVRFARTPPLPTELIFAGVGPFEVWTPSPLSADAVRGRALPLRGLAPRGLAQGLGFALEATRTLVPELEELTGLAFPYEKLDLVLSPGFDGGMENAGAILFGEGLLVPGERSEDGEAQAEAAELLAHELAHQWFGDLSGAASWRDVWLSESFAELMGWKVVEAYRPQFEERMRALVEVDAVMDEDALGTAVAVRHMPEKSDDIAAQFGPVAYAKGAAVLAGFERLLGEERFRGAVAVYLREHQHRNGSADELMAVLSHAAGRDLAPSLRSLLDQPGVPLVVARSVCGADGPRIELKVEREHPLGARPAPDPVYALPVCVRYEAAGSVGEACTLVENGHGSLTVPSCPRWFMPGAGGLAYYRFALRPEDLNRLRDSGYPHLTDPERLFFAQSLRAAVRAGRLRFAEALAMLAPLTRDGDPRVATSAMPLLEEAIEELVPKEARTTARARAAELYRLPLRELGFEPAHDEPSSRRWLRRELAEFMVEVARDPEVTRVLAARGLAYAGLGDGRFHRSEVSPELAPVALEAAVREGDAARFDEMAARLSVTRDEVERAGLLKALGAAFEPALSPRALSLASDTHLTADERARVVFLQAREPESREAAWKVLQKQFGALAPSLVAEEDPLLPDLASRLCDKERVEPLSRFLLRQVERWPALSHCLPGALERVETCASLREAQGASAASWFAGQGGEPFSAPQRAAQGLPGGE